MAESTEKGAAAATASTVEVLEGNGPLDSFKAVVLGATGATGRYLVGELLSSKSFSEITLLGRRKVADLPESYKIDLAKEEESGHLVQQIIDMDEANDENAIKHFEGKDVYFTVFGTTRSKAGGNENFRKIDYGINVKFAEIAKKAGVRLLSLMSTTGANSGSFIFYLKVKGQIEELVSKLEFPLLSIFRPGFLDRKEPPRFLERIVGFFMSKISVEVVAQAMVNDAVIQLRNGKDDPSSSNILTNPQIIDLAKGMSEKKKDAAKSAAATSAKDAAAPSGEEDASATKSEKSEEDKPKDAEAAVAAASDETQQEQEVAAGAKDEAGADVKDATDADVKDATDADVKDATDADVKDATDADAKEEAHEAESEAPPAKADEGQST